MTPYDVIVVGAGPLSPDLEEGFGRIAQLRSSSRARETMEAAS